MGTNRCRDVPVYEPRVYTRICPVPGKRVLIYLHLWPPSQALSLPCLHRFRLLCMLDADSLLYAFIEPQIQVCTPVAMLHTIRLSYHSHHFHEMPAGVHWKIDLHRNSPIVEVQRLCSGKNVTSQDPGSGVVQLEETCLLHRSMVSCATNALRHSSHATA